MTIEADSLKTLQRIEKLLEQSLASGQTDEPTRRRVKVAGQKKSDQPDFDDLNSSVFRATKNIDKLSASADKAADSLKRARGDIVSLRTGIRSATGATAAAMSNLNTAVETVINSMSVAEIVPDSKRKETSDGFTALGNAAAIARLQLGMLSKSAKTLTAALEKAAGVVLKDVVPADEDRVDASEGVIAATTAQTEAAEEAAKQQTKSASLLGGMFNRFGVTLKDTGDKGEWLKGQFSTLGTQLSDALINVIRDVYALGARGINAGDSLFKLYGHAIRAGMSLEEYTAMLQENSAAVVRARSFDDFNASLQKSTKSLAQLGVFGPTANQLAAAMRTSSVQLGVPIAEIDNVAQKQIQTFKELRKSTMMTADGFKELVQTISNNQSVQEELMGLAPQERAARQQQILEVGALGHRLGLTQQASQQLTEALLNQRKSTAEQRFKASGYIKQAGSITGMSAAEAAELARLAKYKNVSQMSSEELKSFVALSGKMEQGIQAMMNSGNIQSEYIAEKLDENLQSTNYGALQKAAAAAVTQTQSGPVANADIGKTTSQVQQDIGQLLTTLSGFMKNPLADAMVTFGSMLAQTLVQTFFLARIARNTDPSNRLLAATPTGGRTPPDMMGPNKPGWREAPGRRLKIETNRTFAQSPVVNAFKDSYAAIKSVLTSGSRMITGYVTGVKGTIQTLGPTVGIISEIALAAQKGWQLLVSAAVGIKNIFVKGGPIGMAFGFIEELFTGEATKFLALGDGLGSRLLGAVIAGFNSFFTGITRLVDDGINWVMEGLGLSFRSNITKLFDVATSYLTDGVKLVLAGLVKTLAAGLKFFGFKDAPWVKSLKETEQGLYKSIEESSANREKLMETEGATMRSLGEQQIKAQKEAADKTKTLAKVTTDNVVYSLDNLAASAQRTVQARAADTATAQVAMPGPTKQSNVTPPEVNKPQVEAKEKRAEEAAQAKEALGPTGSEEMILVLKQQVQILQQMLAYWTQQEDLSEVLLKATSRPSLQSNEKLYVAALGRRASA